MAAEFSARDVVIVGGGCYGTFYARQLDRARAQGKAVYRRLRIIDRDPACQFVREIGVSDTAELVVREWGEFFDEYLGAAAAREAALEAHGENAQRGGETGERSKFRELDGQTAESSGTREFDGEDTIVPSPLMPHLMYEWLLRRARARWPGRSVESRPVPAGPGTPYDVLAPDGTRYVSFADWICPTHCVEPATCPIIRAPRTWEMGDAIRGLTRRLAKDRATAGPVLFVCQHRVFGVGMFDVRTVVAGDACVMDAGTGGGAVDVVVGTISSCHGAVSLLHLGAPSC